MSFSLRTRETTHSTSLSTTFRLRARRFTASNRLRHWMAIPRLFSSLIRAPGTEGLKLGLNLKKRFSKPADYIFIACMPKSGSTFLGVVLSELTGYRRIPLYYACGRTEQDLYLPALIDSYAFHTVTHQHTRATGSNLSLMHLFSIRPVVLVRNIFDTVVSIRDHLSNEGFGFHAFFCDERFNELDEKTQYDCIIELAIPWYFNFYVSWFNASSSGQADVSWLTYEEVMADKVEAIRAVARFCGFESATSDIKKALARAQNGGLDIRFNKGVSGRGFSALTEGQREKIVNMARYYPYVDFSSMGIPQNSNLS